ncbi:TPA_asm: hypothetical protein GNC35_003053 [Salmonella enterica subsp. enterica serovar Enteritidis]|nr:hypothetical protein [Salmonella enterica subsp. enterica]EHW9183250.1 hypothetical protein [Salmonella enterica subsp. enterica]HAE4696849.1 hypothetical protein [Salmonella enterica subsp. enterica serovar Enteritidis]
MSLRVPGGQSAKLQWQQHHKLSGLSRSGTGPEGFIYDRHGNLLGYTDPIRLLGGLNLYAYEPNPLSWIDPLGLSCKSSYSGKLSGKASEMNPLVRGSKAWNQAIEDMQADLTQQ